MTASVNINSPWRLSSMQRNELCCERTSFFFITICMATKYWQGVQICLLTWSLTPPLGTLQSSGTYPRIMTSLSGVLITMPDAGRLQMANLLSWFKSGKLDFLCVNTAFLIRQDRNNILLLCYVLPPPNNKRHNPLIITPEFRNDLS